MHDHESFIKECVKKITNTANLAIKERGRFYVVFAGGKTPENLYSHLRKIETDWAAWDIWFSDERCENVTEPELNSTMACRFLLDHVSVNTDNIHKIQGKLDCESAAMIYQDEIKDTPEFDLVLLGIGEDGHTASLFRGNDLGDKGNSPDVIAVKNAPKPPSQRVTLTVNRLNNSKEVLFIVAGKHKESIMKSYSDGDDLPASAVRGRLNTTILFCPEDISIQN